MMTALTERPHAPVAEQPRRGGDRFVAGGLLLAAALFAAVQVLAGEVIPPLAVPMVVYAAFGFALARSAPRWLLVTTAVLLTLHLLTSLPFLVGALSHPETPGSFLPDAFIVITVVTVVIGALVGLRGRRNRRPLAGGAAALAAVVAVVSLVAAAGVSSDERQDGDVPVETVRTMFPAELAVPAGGATLWIDNQDAFRHTFVVDGADVHAELPGSTAVRVDVDLAPGTYRYFCDVPGHERMEGQIVAR